MVMKVRTMGYCVKQGVLNSFKNRMMSLASMGTISACIFVIGIFYCIVSNVDYIVEENQKKVGVVVFFDEGTDEKRILDIKKTINERKEVHKIDYTSAESAWNEHKVKYFEGREELLSGFEEDNPLKDSASLQIFLSDITKQGRLVNFINALDGVRMVREDREATNIIQNFNELIKYLSVILISILVLVSVFLISNTVRLAIQIRKREINIMKYVGATDGLIRGPFIIEGIVIGFVGAIIPLGFIYFFYNDAKDRVLEEFSTLSSFLVFQTVNDIFAVLLPLALVIGIVIGAVGSLLTIHKHLRV